VIETRTNERSKKGKKKGGKPAVPGEGKRPWERGANIGGFKFPRVEEQAEQPVGGETMTLKKEASVQRPGPRYTSSVYPTFWCKNDEGETLQGGAGGGKELSA